MKKQKKCWIAVSVAILLLSCITVTVVFAVSQAASTDGYQPLHEKPAIGDLIQEPMDPPEKSSDTSVAARSKEWYEYITYSQTPVNETPIVIDDHTRVFYYDPFDYSYGMIMEANTDTQTGYDTVNQYEISVKTTHSLEVKFGESVQTDVSLTSTIKASAGAGMKDFFWAETGTEITSKLSTTLEANITVTEFDETVKTVDKTFYAVYFSEYGAPYAWKLVDYTVYLPLKCDVQFKKSDGTWVSSGEDVYCLLATVQGTCRSYIKNNVAYIEHWGTGEPVTVDDFWQGFFTKEALIRSYQNSLLPQK